jgi:hypothetical protein
MAFCWYRHVTPENIERIIQEQLLGGRLVAELSFAVHALASKRNAAIGLIASIR